MKTTKKSTHRVASPCHDISMELGVSRLRAVPRFILFFLFALLLLSEAALAQQSRQQQKDSLRLLISQCDSIELLFAYQRLALLYYSESANSDAALDTMLTIYAQLDEVATRLNDPSKRVVLRANTLFALNNRGDYDETIRLSPEFMQFAEEQQQWDKYYHLFRCLVKAYLFKGDSQNALSEAQKLFTKARERGDKEGEACALYAMAEVYSKQQRVQESEACIRPCITLLEELVKTNGSHLGMLANARFYLCETLRVQKRYEEMFEEALKLEADSKLLEQQTKSPIPTTWSNLYVIFIEYYCYIRDWDRAAEYCDKLEALNMFAVENKYNLLKGRARILSSRQRYEEALQKADEAMEISLERNVLDQTEVMMLRGDILASMGKGEEASDLFQAVVTLRDSIRDVDFNGQLDELRTQYEVDKHIVEKQRQRTNFLWALAGCFMLLILLGIVFYYNRMIWKKNRSLYQRIKEQDHLARELEEMSQLAAAASGASSPEQEAEMELPYSIQQKMLVARLRDYLLKERNYANVDLSRDSLLLSLATNRTTLSEAVKAVTEKTLMEYIQFVRLEEARLMLEKSSELTVEAIAEACGFNAPNTFYRQFRKHYNIAPAEYRKIARLS
ncbi:helix-turn-helix domain-containing protein [Parabacteroides sp. OttesenSCG-928-N08]|nr:helix-turn-helix domain-containing protein [Parabacteroides sp. OttesenSCG-928-N08]